MQIFIANIHGQEEINNMAASIGLKAGGIQVGTARSTIAAIGGNTFSIKDVLKEHGAKWDKISKVWTFDSIESRDAAIRDAANI